MELLIFKTNIESNKKIQMVKPIFNNDPTILDWSVDTEDIDNVLRIESAGGIDENKIIGMINTCGFKCENLPD